MERMERSLEGRGGCGTAGVEGEVRNQGWEKTMGLVSGEGLRGEGGIW